MGCGSSNAVRIEISSLDYGSSTSEFVVDKFSDVSGCYNIHSGPVSHTLLLLEDGRVVLDGKFARSVVYKQGKKEFKFKMFEDSSLLRGEVRFSDAKSINGVFYTTDDSSYVVQGNLADNSDGNNKTAPAVSAAKNTIVIDEHTLKRYISLEKRLERYASRDLLPEILRATKRGEELEQGIRDKVGQIETMRATRNKAKEEHGAESDETKAIDIELESECLALASDQEEYDNVLKYIRSSTSALFDYNIMAEQFDELLNVMFGGDNGSEMENMLEELVEEKEEARKIYDTAFDREETIWQDSKNVCTLVLQALNTWTSLQRDDYQDKQRLFLAKQTRSLLVLISQSLVGLEIALKDYQTANLNSNFNSNLIFKQEKDCLEKIEYFKANIFEMFTEEAKIEEGVDILLLCKEATSRVEQWVYNKFKLKDCHDTSEAMKNGILEAKMKLKKERRDLIQDWLMEHVGEGEKEDRLSVEEYIEREETLVDETQVKEEFDISMSYEKIVSDMHEREGKPELANIRAELELQSKIRARRQRQRHQRAQKLIQAQT